MGERKSERLALTQCVAMADEWAMLSRRSEKWKQLVQYHTAWTIQRGIWAPSRNNLHDGSTTRLQSFLNQRHALSQGWNTAYRNDWVTKFNDFYIFALTARVTG